MTRAEGKHTPTQFLHILWAVQETKQSGQLHVESGAFQKTIYFLDGNAIFYESNSPDDELQNSLKRHAVIPEAQLNWLLSKISNDDLEQELLTSGIFSEEQLLAHQIETMQEGIGQCLSWETGHWHFVAHPWLKACITPELQIQLGLLSALWKGVHRISDNRVYTLLSDVMSHKFQGKAEDIQHTLQILELEGWEWFQKELEEEHTLTEIAQEGPNEVELDSFRLIWIMFHLGLLNAEQPTEILDIIENAEALNRNTDRKLKLQAEQEREERKKRAQERRERRAKAQERDKVSLSKQIEHEYQKRMGADFYTFVGMPVEASYKQVETQVRKLTGIWKQWLKKTLSSGDRESVRELLMGIQVVYAVLIDPERRPIYDQTLKKGTATLMKNPKTLYLEERRRKNKPKESSSKPQKASSKRSASSKANPDQMRKEHINSLLQQKNFDRALPLLLVARQESSSDPDILAQLGWCIWQVKKEADRAKEYIQLAITFDSKHTDAFEWYSRILVEKKEDEQAIRILKHLVKLSPNHKWGTQTLQRLLKAEEERSNKGWFNRK